VLSRKDREIPVIGICGRTTRGQSGPTDSSPAQNASQGDQRQLSTADSTNDLVSSPEKREEGTRSVDQREKKRKE
jgi:hypothetical protein